MPADGFLYVFTYLSGDFNMEMNIVFEVKRSSACLREKGDQLVAFWFVKVLRTKMC